MIIVREIRQYSKDGYRGQTISIGGIERNRRKQMILHEKEKEFLKLAAYIGTIEFNVKRSVEQKHERKMKRIKI